VRIEAGGLVRGVGFFVAPGKVLTTAYVAAEGTVLSIVSDRDDRQPVGQHVARSAARLLGGQEIDLSILTDQFPQLAVIDVDGFDGHPCVLIDEQLPAQGDSFLLFGYEADVDRHHEPLMTPARLSYRGLRGTLPQAFLDLTGDTIERGMGGAAVLNLRTHMVSGVVAMRRNSSSPAGVLAIPWAVVWMGMADLLASNKAFHELDRRWAEATEMQTADSPVPPLRDGSDRRIDPSSLTSRAAFAMALRELHDQSQLTISLVARRSSVSPGSISSYLNGRSLPMANSSLTALLRAYDVDELTIRDQWLPALRHARKKSVARLIRQADESVNLIFRLYIPTDRLYAPEAARLLSLFRDWLAQTRGQSIRQSGYKTASGEMFEFYADPAAAPNLNAEFRSFSTFLDLCADDPSAAADMLVPTGLGRALSNDLVAKFSREVRRLQIDLRHERERRILTIRHSLEEELVDSGVDMRVIPGNQLNDLIERMVPDPTAPAASLALLGGPESRARDAPVTLQITQQFITAAGSTIVQNVQGTVNLGPQAKQLLDLVDQFGGQQKNELEAAVHELEDSEAPAAARSKAQRRLKQFLGRFGGIAHDVAIDLLEKYLESKGL
jgi:transcriptional regulator with XRE-family HTH domain